MGRYRKLIPTKVQRHRAEEKVNPILLEGGTLQEACEAFEEATGERIHLSSMGRHNRRIQEGIEKMQRVEILVDKIIEKNPGARAASYAREMLLAQAAEAVAEVTPEAMAKLAPDQLARMVIALERSRNDADRLRLQFTKGFETAKRAILAKMAEDLRDHPDLLDAVREVADRAAAEEEARAGVLELDESGRPIVVREEGEG